MRILILDSYYLAFLSHHQAERPGLSTKPYDEQLAELMRRFMGTSDAYSRHLRALGHEATEVVYNYVDLQAAWAREHEMNPVARSLLGTPGVGAAARWRLLRKVLDAQLSEYDPEVVYVQDLNILGRARAERLRSEGRLLVAQIGSMPPATEVLRRYDLLVTSFPHYVERFRVLGIDTEYFAIGFDTAVFERLQAEQALKKPGDTRSRDAVFVGTIHPPDVHRAGTSLLERIAAETNVEFWGHIEDRLAPGSPILSRHHGEVWGLDMYRLLADARVTVNRHGDVAERNANNMRLFEATAMGSLLLTERADNLGELFEPGREVVPYDRADDLIEKVRHYVAHPDEAAEIAAAGQRRTLRDHTYGRRIPQLAAMLEARLR